ncbi:MAG: hypothetical protein FJY36_02160 [Betaproteobacteria bacterium]|nr:hypothetical protein [Betaproteobacteria bacterium]
MDTSELTAQHLLLQQGGVLLHSLHPDRDEAQFRLWLDELGLHQGVITHQLIAGADTPILCQLDPCFRIQHMPLHDTLAIHQRWQQFHRQALTLEQETVLALLAAPQTLTFADLPALQSHVRVRVHIAQAGRCTALAFKTQAAERPEAFWHYDEAHGFLLNPGCDLIEAIEAATQPEATGKLYDFSCYRATEYVILLGIARELRAHHPELYAQLQQTCERHAIRSGQFHEVFLIEYGSLQHPLPAHYYIPGDRLWFRNPDARSSDIEGYEGSWVIYLGQGQFSNFWERDRPFSLESKCLEVHHWRDGVCTTAQGQLEMDETQVARAVANTRNDPQALLAALDRMMRLRDPQGVYAEGGCIDASREFPRSVSRHHGQLVLPRFTD